MSDLSQSFGKAAKRNLEEQGWCVDTPGNRDLFLDIDTDAQFAVFERNFETLKKQIGYDYPDHDFEMRVTPSPSKAEGRHIRLKMPFKLSPLQRIAWQASLGSDPMRELLSLVRESRGDDMPTILKERCE